MLVVLLGPLINLIDKGSLAPIVVHSSLTDRSLINLQDSTSSPAIFLVGPNSEGLLQSVGGVVSVEHLDRAPSCGQGLPFPYFQLLHGKIWRTHVDASRLELHGSIQVAVEDASDAIHADASSV